MLLATCMSFLHVFFVGLALLLMENVAAIQSFLLVHTSVCGASFLPLNRC
jgi:hypothetical protein